MAAPEDTLPADIGLEQLRTKVHGRLFGSRLEPPKIGRYEIREYLGAGGMGVVYSAWDAELDRAVAIKLLRSDGLKETARERLRREAKALAKLSHPNVVHVYEVGSDAGRVFVAMEYVEGETLAQWLEDDTHDIEEILAMFVEIGRGLAAAHEAGFVHRDFKPDNVLIDSSGRPRVVDFGLVLGPHDHATTQSGPALEAEASGDAPLSLTATGTLVGTPAYMAPEQHRGETADARTDLFAYCVALYEALYGLRPFGGDSYQLLAASVLRGALRVPPPEKLHRVPKAIREAVARGLARDPADRFASMNDLLDALTRRPRARVHPAWIGAGAAAVAFGAFALGALMQPAAEASDEGGEICEAASVKLEGAWDPDVRTRVREAFLRTDQAFADESFAQVDANLGAWAARWMDAWGSACESALGVDVDEAEIGMRQMRCLEVRLAEVRQLTEVFSEADASVVRQAADASAGFADATSCDASFDTTPRVANDETRAVELQLARAAGMLAAGRDAGASRLAMEARAAARQAERPDLAAKASLVIVRAGASEDPIRSLHEVVALAQDAADHRTEAEAWIEMIAQAAQSRQESSRELPAAAWADMAQRLLDRDPDKRLQIALHYNLARFFGEHDAFDAARERLDLAQRVDVDRATLAGARLETALGEIEVRAGRNAVAAEHFREARLRLRNAVGDDHPHTVSNALMLAAVTDDPKEAADLSRKAYAKSVTHGKLEAADVEQAVRAFEVMRKVCEGSKCADDAVAEAELEAVLEEAGAETKKAKALAKATQKIVARTDAEVASLVIGDGIAIVVDGDRTKVSIDTSKIGWSVPGCKRGKKCTVDSWSWSKEIPKPPKPPKVPTFGKGFPKAPPPPASAPPPPPG